MVTRHSLHHSGQLTGSEVLQNMNVKGLRTGSCRAEGQNRAISDLWEFSVLQPGKAVQQVLYFNPALMHWAQCNSCCVWSWTHTRVLRVQGHALVILSTCSALNCSKILNQVFIKGKSISFITMNSQCSALKLQLLKTWWKASSIKHPKPSDLRVLFRIRDNIHYRSTDCEEQNCKEQLWKYYCNWNDSESKTSAIKIF